jgi:hypothetical protein
MGRSKLRSEAIRLVRRYLAGKQDGVVMEVVRRANTTGENLLLEMWQVMEKEGLRYDPDIAELLDRVSEESLRWHERGELWWQKQQVSPGT